MNDIIKYKPEFILTLKNEFTINEEYSIIFENIINLMTSSTDQKNFKVKMSKDITLNSNKWHRKRFLTDNEKCKMKINSCLNRYSHVTYNEVTLDILKLDFFDIDLMLYFINTFTQKYIMDYDSDIWNYMLEKLIFSNVNKWKINGKHFIEHFLDNLQVNFNKITEGNYQSYLEELWTNDIDEFYLIKRKNQGLMKLISEMFKYKLITRDVIMSILQNLTLNINLYYKLELGVALIRYIYEYIEENEKVKFLEYFSIYLKDKNLNVKIKFMILDFIENNKKNENINNEITFHNDEQIEAILKNSFDEYFNDNDIYPFFQRISKIKVPHKSNKIVYFFILNIIENFEKLDDYTELMSKLLNKKIIKFNNLKYGLVEFMNDYEDYKWDYNNLDQMLSLLLKKFKILKILTEDNIKFIFSKLERSINLEVH